MVITPDLKIIWNFVNINFISQLFGGFLATLLFWFVIERSIKDFIEIREKKKLTKMFIEEMALNNIIANQVVESSDRFIRENKFTFLKYELNSIDNFLNLESLELDVSFYRRLRVLKVALKKDNMLLDMFWFSPQVTIMDRIDYKGIFLNNAKLNASNISKILGDEGFKTQCKRLSLID